MGKEGGLTAQLGQAAGFVGGGAVGAAALGGRRRLVGSLGGQRGLGAAGQLRTLVGLPQGSPAAGCQGQAGRQGQQAPVGT